ncbi:envelope glycoprotein O [Proboscivirus elephantidbeta4]|uniref:Envelope glycoprotein O n=1 Tax=Elephant endotheliotropic herpesvirus 4 TaxID=548914 RepID=A0A0S1TP92_9BETA|nr:envelope glycoprotein O [Elephant endotheliotropic herpesvirus 4]ALM25997.1 envelope glycoprotein O [Elephant endotheliotropic herpesvirus 4]
MAVPEALTQFATFLNSSSLPSKIPYYYPMRYVCNLTSPDTEKSFVKCYIYVTTVLIYSLNKHTFNCTDRSVKNIYQIAMPGAAVLVSFEPKKCYSSNTDYKCDLELTLQDIVDWVYRAVIIVKDLDGCYPWQHVKYISDYIVKAPIYNESAFVNATYQFINAVVHTNVSMEHFLLLTVASMVRSLGPNCPPVPGILNPGAYMNRVLKPEGLPNGYD